MNDLDLLVILSNKENYQKYSKFIKEHLVSKEVWIILQDLEEWYEDKSDVDWDKFSTWFRITKHVMFKPDKMELFTKIFDKLSDYDADEDLQDALLASLIDRDFATRLAEITLSIAEGSDEFSMDEVYSTINDYEISSHRASESLVDELEWSFEEIFSNDTDADGLEWTLPELQEAVGPISKGDFLAIAAYSGNGKTTLLCNESRGWVDQCDDEECVLWFNNEEAGKKVVRRFFTSYLGKTKEDIQSNPLAFKTDVEKILDKFIFVDNAGLTTADIERIIRKHNPRVIIIDQLYKVHGYEKSSSNDVARIGSIFNWGREIAKKYAPVVAVHQADGSSAGQKWIEKNQLHMSKVGIVGELDCLITIGKTNDPNEESIRFLYTPKNKLTGNESYKAPIEIVANIGRYKSLL